MYLNNKPQINIKIYWNILVKIIIKRYTFIFLYSNIKTLRFYWIHINHIICIDLLEHRQRKIKKTKVASERKIKPKNKSPKKEVKAIQGLSKRSFDSKGVGSFSAPVGNTLMIEDEGIRVKEAEEFVGDLSQRAKLLSFEKPSYTEDAIDSELEGIVIISVFIDKKGVVLEAELEKKIGFGMDELLTRAAKSARFSPRLNRYGKAVEGWDEITVRLEIP